MKRAAWLRAAPRRLRAGLRRLRGVLSVCPVCGQRGVEFSGFTDNLRESGICSHCGSFNRQRQLAHVMRQTLGLRPAGSLASQVRSRIYNLEASGAMHAALASVPGYVCSEYFGPEFRGGERVQGIRHEDLQQLSFQDASFDLVLSSDVLEHMPDPYQAHAEVARVLAPGGRHVFTVPYDPGAADDDVRARLGAGGIEYLAPALYHGDPVRPTEGILVFTIFGRAMLNRLAALGFAVTVHQLDEPSCGILGDGAIVFEARKSL